MISWRQLEVLVRCLRGAAQLLSLGKMKLLHYFVDEFKDFWQQIVLLKWIKALYSSYIRS